MARTETLLPYHTALNGPVWPGYPNYPEITHQIPPETKPSHRISGAYVTSHPVFEDLRGFFAETFRHEKLIQTINQDIPVLQENQSGNLETNTYRGLHIAPWYKICRVITGSVLATLFDTRRHSPTFGNLEVYHLKPKSFDSSGKLCIQDYIVPPGCAHGYLALEPGTELKYLVTQPFPKGPSFTSPAEVGLSVLDPFIGSQFESLGYHLPYRQLILSDKDKSNPRLIDIFPDVPRFKV